MIKDNTSLSKYNVAELEKSMLELPQAEFETNHFFGDNLYIREVRLPAGIFALGHYQKTHHVNIMIAGVVIMINEDGTTQRLEAPQTFIGKPGRKIGYIVEDVIWQNVFSTSETDIEKLEETYLDKSDVWKESQNLIDNTSQIIADNIDYQNFLKENKFNEQQARLQTENKIDQIKMPAGYEFLQVKKSNIQGVGMFSDKDLKEGEFIAPARINSMRTPAGRYVNHSMNPNSIMVRKGNDIDMKAIKKIMAGEEITINYRDSLQAAKDCKL